MDKFLSILVSTWNVVDHIVTWALINPAAAAFWSGLALVVLDRVVALTPWKGDDGLLKIAKDAVFAGYQRARGR